MKNWLANGAVGSGHGRGTVTPPTSTNLPGVTREAVLEQRERPLRLAPEPVRQRPSALPALQASPRAQQHRALHRRQVGRRREHGVLASGVRVGKVTTEGERVYMDDATRDARLARLKDELRGCP